LAVALVVGITDGSEVGRGVALDLLNADIVVLELFVGRKLDGVVEIDDMIDSIVAFEADASYDGVAAARRRICLTFILLLPRTASSACIQCSISKHSNSGICRFIILEVLVFPTN
jgi:hypothetical protein